jgi:excisionase family DNA binding protein
LRRTHGPALLARREVGFYGLSRPVLIRYPTRVDGGRNSSGNRVSVYEAAEVLGVTVDAIRKRIQRGTIPHERDEDGRVFVWVDATQDAARDAALINELQNYRRDGAPVYPMTLQ